MVSPLAIDPHKYRKQAVKDAEQEFAWARTTQERHKARLALQKARRALEALEGERDATQVR